MFFGTYQNLVESHYQNAKYNEEVRSNAQKIKLLGLELMFCVRSVKPDLCFTLRERKAGYLLLLTHENSFDLGSGGAGDVGPVVFCEQ